MSDHESRIWSREGRSIDVDGYVERIENLQRSPEALFLIRAEVIADDRLSEDARQFLDARIGTYLADHARAQEPAGGWDLENVPEGKPSLAYMRFLVRIARVINDADALASLCPEIRKSDGLEDEYGERDQLLHLATHGARHGVLEVEASSFALLSALGLPATLRVDAR